MTKRLQVLFEDSEMRDIQRAARVERMTVAAWVRQAIRRARSEDARPDPRDKFAAVERASRHDFPIGDIDEVVSEIEQGYLGERSL